LHRERQKVERREQTEKARQAEHEQRLKAAAVRKAAREQKLKRCAEAHAGAQAQDPSKDTGDVMHKHIHHHVHYHQQVVLRNKGDASLHSSIEDDGGESPEEDTPGLKTKTVPCNAPPAPPAEPLSEEERRRIEEESEQTVHLPPPQGSSPSVGQKSSVIINPQMARTIESFAPEAHAALRHSHSESAMPRHLKLCPRFAQGIQRATPTYNSSFRLRYARNGRLT